MRLSKITPEIMKLALDSSHNYKTLSNFLGVSPQHRNNKFFIKYCLDNNIEIPKHFNSGRFSRLSKLDKQELQQHFNNSNSYSEILTKCGFRISGGNLKTLKKLADDYEISYELLNNNRSNNHKNRLVSRFNIYSLSYNELKNNHSFNSIKKYIRYYNLIEYICKKCGNIGEYNGEPLILELDHIDGNHKNNELSNFRFLCPNCHSQTETHSGRNRIKITTPKVCECGTIISKKSSKCVKCSNNENKLKLRKFEVSKEELEKLIIEKPMTEIGKMFGVSDNAIKKRCKKLEILLKPKNTKELN